MEAMSVRVAGRRVIEDIVILVLVSQCSGRMIYFVRGYSALMLFYVVLLVVLN